MKLKAHIAAALGLSMVVVALIVPATAVGQASVSGYLDAADRSAGALAAAPSGLTNYRDGPERGSTVATSQTSVAGYLDSNERAQSAQIIVPAGLAGYVDAFERGEPVRESSQASTALVGGGGGFDWGAAAVGASSALFLALLVGMSLIVVRHSRGRPLVG